MERFTATRGAVHAHFQVVPVPLAELAEVRRTFERDGAKQGVAFEELPPGHTLEQAVGRSFYFYVEVSAEAEGGAPTRLLHHVQGLFRAQFGREVLASVLKTPKKANWKACVVSQTEETAQVDVFKAAFQPFDFALGAE